MASETLSADYSGCTSLIPEINSGTDLASELKTRLNDLSYEEFDAFVAATPDSFDLSVWKWWADYK